VGQFPANNACFTRDQHRLSQWKFTSSHTPATCTCEFKAMGVPVGVAFPWALKEAKLSSTALSLVKTARGVLLSQRPSNSKAYCCCCYCQLLSRNLFRISADGCRYCNCYCGWCSLQFEHHQPHQQKVEGKRNLHQATSQLHLPTGLALELGPPMRKQNMLIEKKQEDEVAMTLFARKRSRRGEIE